jgi:hypothetical protein
MTSRERSHSSSVILVEELHLADGIRDGKALRNPPGHIRAVTLVLPAKATDLPAPDEQERV